MHLPTQFLASEDIQSAITLSGEESRAFPCQREGCGGQIQPGQLAYFVKGKDRKVRVCEGCKDYYIVKRQARQTQTKQETATWSAYPSAHSSTVPPSPPKPIWNGQQLNVERIEKNIRGSFHRDSSAQYQQLIRPVNVGAVPVSSSLNIRIGGHSTHPPHPLSREKASGYTTQHARHSEEYQKFASRAFASNQDSIPIKLLLAYVDESCDTVTRLPALSQMDNQYSIYSSFETMIHQMLRLGQDALQRFEDLNGATGLNYNWSNVTGIQLRDITKDQNSASRAGAGVDLQGPTVAKYRVPGCNTFYLAQYGKWTVKKQGHQEWKPQTKSVLFRMDIPGDEWERFERKIRGFKRLQSTARPENLTWNWNDDVDSQPPTLPVVDDFLQSELVSDSPNSEMTPSDVQSAPLFIRSESMPAAAARLTSSPPAAAIINTDFEKKEPECCQKNATTAACLPSTTAPPPTSDSTIPSKRRQMHEPDTPPSKAATASNVWSSPSAKSVQDAVIHGGLAGKRSTGANRTLPLTVIHGDMIVLPRRSFTEASIRPSTLKFEVEPDLSTFLAIELHVDFRREQQIGSGSFKTCHPAMIRSVAGDAFSAFPSQKVCLKQMYEAKLDKVAGKRSTEGGSFPRLSGALELEKIQIDANVHYWADMLLLSAYEYIDDLSKREGRPQMPGPLPKLRFVRAAVLCVAKDKESRRRIGVPIDRSYLLEERIDSPFVKYIHNGSPEILLRKSHPEYPTAVFLSAIQHLQYEKFQRTVFTSDWQGAKGLLTDPQIMTASGAIPGIDEGLPQGLFGGGNVGKAFSAFPLEHACTAWCGWFGLSKFVEQKDDHTGAVIFPSTAQGGPSAGDGQ